MPSDFELLLYISIGLCVSTVQKCFLYKRVSSVLLTLFYRYTRLMCAMCLPSLVTYSFDVPLYFIRTPVAIVEFFTVHFHTFFLRRSHQEAHRSQGLLLLLCASAFSLATFNLYFFFFIEACFFSKGVFLTKALFLCKCYAIFYCLQFVGTNHSFVTCARDNP